MIIDSVAGNIHDRTPDELVGRHIERVPLDGPQLRKRIQRVVSDHGRELGLRLPGRGELRDGDILLDEGRDLVVVASLPTEVLAIAPDGVYHAAHVAHALGNRHLPAQFFDAGTEFAGLEGHDGVMVIQYDHTAEDFLREAGVRHVRLDRVMEVPFRHAEHSH